MAAGLTRLVNGTQVNVGKLGWSEVRSGLTTGDKTIDIVGVSGPLDFDINAGEAPAKIEVWQPSEMEADCDGSAPCFKVLTTVE